MTLDRVVEVSFALTLLFALPTMVCLAAGWMDGFFAFGAISVAFGMCELGAIALAALLGR